MKILTTVSFAFEKTRAKRVPFALAFGVWGLPHKARVGILHGSEKVPSVCPCSMLFKPLNFSL